MRSRWLGTSVAILVAAGAACATSGEAQAGPPATKSSQHYADWSTYHGSYHRRGYASTMPHVRGRMTIAKRLDLDGAVYASPLVIGGVTVVATENNSVYAFGPHLHRLWKRHLGAPSPRGERPCGDIDPLGITGTPVYSHKTHDVYLVAEHAGTFRHDLVALSLRTGKVQWHRDVDLPGANPQVMQQRGALTNRGGRIWVPFGALAGDCGKYKGRVVGVRLDGKGKRIKFQPSTHRQGGIWNPQGGTVDRQGHLLFVSANGSTFPGDKYDHTNSVNKIDIHGHRLGSFAPTDWAQNNQGDVGLGSQGVALVGHKWLVLGGKSGPVYVLHQHHLGGIGGQVSVKDICLSFGGAAVLHSTVYLPCTDGIRAVRVSASGHLHVLWHADSSVAGSPVIGGGRVWGLDQGSGVLHALSIKSGRTVQQIDVGTTSRFATPALYGHRVYVPTMTGLTVVRVS